MDSSVEASCRLEVLKSSKNDIEKLNHDHDHHDNNHNDDMSAQEKYDIVRSIGEECIEDEDQLNNLFKNKPQPVSFDGFEPSGRMQIAQGIVKAINIKKLTSAGCKVKILIADVFMNNNMGGDKSKIHVCGKYFIEIWKALGINPEDGMVEFLRSSEEMEKRPTEYRNLVMDISSETTNDRIMRCNQIMDLKEQEKLKASQNLYPILQCADIFFLGADICQMGMDKQQVNMLAREIGDKSKLIKEKYSNRGKPIILSHHMIPGLKPGQESDPKSSVFMEDEEEVVNSKIKKASCDPGVVEGNPCLEYIKYIVLPWFQEFSVERTVGGLKIYTSFEEVAKDYKDGNLHPGDLKPALANALNEILQPVRDHFKNDDNAGKLLEAVKGYNTLTMDSSVLKSSKNDKEREILAHIQKLNVDDNNPSDDMSAAEKYDIVRSIGEECTTDNELKNLFKNKPQPVSYDGFEPSGRMHIAQGIVKAINVKKLTSAGCKVKILIADAFAFMNKKMGGDKSKIHVCGKYFIEIWKALGINPEDSMVEFLWSSEEIDKRLIEYWKLVWDISSETTNDRIVRCCQIMGRKEQDKLNASQNLYPIMQCADIFFLEADICQMGKDQRKVNMLAREICKSKFFKEKYSNRGKPIILSHHMIPGLKPGQEKMSKSDQESSIFMEDEEEVVYSKIMKASCDPGVVEGNPCLEYIKYIVLPWFQEFSVERTVGGLKIYTSFEEVAKDYKDGNLHPGDLQPALANALNEILQPVRDHFKNDDNAGKLLEAVKGFNISKC